MWPYCLEIADTDIPKNNIGKNIVLRNNGHYNCGKICYFKVCSALKQKVHEDEFPPGKKVLVRGNRCYRCKHEWRPRNLEERATVCPNCKSPYWHRPRRHATTKDAGAEPAGDEFRSGSNVLIRGHRCHRCKHAWRPRNLKELPRVCPNCKSVYWDEEKGWKSKKNTKTDVTDTD